jgi:xanthine dehydrogenase accessory factor
MLANGVAESELARLRAPVGLDIGADSPGEIAVSVVAEVIAQRRGVSGGSISERTGPIHPGLAPGTAECPSG